jgi:hypothetical protein
MSDQPRRVLLAVVPRLFSDILRGLIAEVGLEVTEMTPGTLPNGRFDAAVVNTEVELAPIEVETLVVLPSTPDGRGAARITSGGHEDWVELTSVGDLIAVIDRLPSDPGSV